MKTDANSILVNQGGKALRDEFDRLVSAAERAANGKDPAPAEAAAPKPLALVVFDVGDETGDIQPRQWLLGNAFCRGFLSGLVAAGAVGKTTVRLLQLLSLACARELTGEHVFVRCRILVLCLDDDLSEARRRVRASMLHHKIKPSDVKGYLFLTSPRGMKIAQYGPTGAGVVRGDLYRALDAEIERLKIDVVCIDPTLKAHGLKENENGDIDQFADILAQLAIQKNIAIDLTSHERKGAKEPGDAERQRGSSSQKDAARLVYTLTPMSKEDARPLGVGEEERRSLVRVDSAKVNIAPPSTKATWFRLVGVPLGNGTPEYPSGDVVQSVEMWTPPPIFGELSEADLNRALRRINAGMGDGRRYSAAPAAKDRHAWWAVQAEFPHLDEQRCKAIVAAWVKNRVFVVGECENPVTRKKVSGILSAALIGETREDE